MYIQCDHNLRNQTGCAVLSYGAFNSKTVLDIALVWHLAKKEGLIQVVGEKK